MEKDKNNVPLFKTWTGWYVVVIGFLLIQIIFFYFFTKYFS